MYDRHNPIIKWYEYDAGNNLIYEKSSNGNEIWWEYDADGNKISEKFSDGSEKNFGLGGSLAYEKMANGNEYWFNAAGKITHIKNVDRSELWYDYDKNGNRNYEKNSNRKRLFGCPRWSIPNRWSILRRKI